MIPNVLKPSFASAMILVVSLLPVACSAAGSDPGPSLTVGHGDMTLYGLVHAQYYHGLGNINESTFSSKRARIGVTGRLNEFGYIKILAEFAATPKLLDGLFKIVPNERLAISIGQYKPPFGTDFALSAANLPFVNSSLAKGLGTDRDVGMHMTFYEDFNEDLDITFDAGIFNGAWANTSDANTYKNFISRLEFGFLGMFSVASNVIVGKTNSPEPHEEDLNTYGGSVSFNWENEVLVCEYILSERGNLEKTGWYVWGGHTVDTGLSFLTAVQVLARYEEYDGDVDIDGDGKSRITLGTNLFIDGKYTKIQLNYQVNGEEGGDVDNDEVLANFQVAF